MEKKAVNIREKNETDNTESQTCKVPRRERLPRQHTQRQLTGQH